MSFYQKILAKGRDFGFTTRIIALLLVFQVGAVAFEAIGLSMLLPIIEFIEHDGDLAVLTEKAIYWEWLINIFQGIGLSINQIVLSLVCFIAILIRQIFEYVRVMYEFRTQEELIRKIRLGVFNNYLHAETRTFDGIRSGELTNELLIETPRAISAVIAVVRVLGSSILLMAYFALMTSLSMELTLSSAILGGCSALAVLTMMQKSRRLSKEITKANQNVSDFLAQRFRSVRLIRLAGTEQQELNGIEKLTLNQINQSIWFQKTVARVNALLDPLVVAMALAYLYIGHYWLDLSLGEIGLFMLITMRLAPHLKTTIRMHQIAIGFSASLEIVHERLMSLMTSRESSGGSLGVDDGPAKIEFRNVSYRYGGSDNDVPALTDATLVMEKGQLNALVGPSGSGKSTLVDLIPYLRSPQEGRILINDQNICDYLTSALRAKVAFVPQQPHFFNSTVAEHIRYGKADASMKDVEKAAALAGAADFISRLPEGYETILGETGQRLSGGQRQRVDIARALIGQPSILILDEPTSSLDVQSEEAFQQTLADLRKTGRITIIVIAHRLATILNADQIIVLNNGRVEASGKHEDLMNASGWYSMAFNKQRLSDT